MFVYLGKLRVCERGFSEGKSEASKRATNIGLAKTSNFLYYVGISIFYLLIALKRVITVSPKGVNVQ